jgi:hypothetical protein
VTLLERDVRRIELADASSFDLSVAPFRVLQHFVAADDQLDVLVGARRRGASRLAARGAVRGI